MKMVRIKELLFIRQCGWGKEYPSSRTFRGWAEDWETCEIA
jgi:hypothetical protein